VSTENIDKENLRQTLKVSAENIDKENLRQSFESVNRELS
jgi:hypothetical protein